MNPLLAQIEPSLIRELHARKKPGDIDLGLGEPTLRPSMVPFEKAHAWIADNGSPYSPNAGFSELREAIATNYRFPGMDTGAAVCVTNGSQEALYAAIKAVCDPGRDLALITEPCYPLYPKVCQLEGIGFDRLAFPAETGFRPEARSVLGALKPNTRLLILCSPSNPTGRCWDRHELQALAEGLQDRDLWVLSDEVYRELYYTDEPPASMAEFYPRTIVVNSLSKSNALTGMRVGWAIAPPEAMGAILKVHQFVNSCASTYSQRVALEVFAANMLDEHRPIYRQRRERLIETLQTLRLEHVVPEGSFYCMVKLPERLAADSMAAAMAIMREACVVTIPGRAFGRISEGWLRVSWVGEPEVVEEGLGRLAAYFRGL